MRGLREERRYILLVSDRVRLLFCVEMIACALNCTRKRWLEFPTVNLESRHFKLSHTLANFDQLINRQGLQVPAVPPILSQTLHVCLHIAASSSRQSSCGSPVA